MLGGQYTSEEGLAAGRDSPRAARSGTRMRKVSGMIVWLDATVKQLVTSLDIYSVQIATSLLHILIREVLILVLILVQAS